MKYDLEIAMPVCNRGPYLRRINDFKKYGILNIKDTRLLMTLLIGKDENPQGLDKGWPRGVDVNIVVCPIEHEACKVYHYFTNYPLEGQVRWIAKFDDDSITDVSALVEKLDREYDHTREYYVCTAAQDDVDDVEFHLLNSMGFGWWFEYGDREPFIYHEIEGCVVSAAGLSRILATPLALELMQKRAVIPEGYTDVCLAAAAKIAKICPTHARFMTNMPFMAHFTYFGGNIAHIHFIAHDRNATLLEGLIKKIEDNRSPEDKSIRDQLINKRFLLTNQNENIACVISFCENSRVQIMHTEDYFGWALWEIDNEELILTSDDGEAFLKFPNFNIDSMDGYCTERVNYKLNRIL